MSKNMGGKKLLKLCLSVINTHFYNLLNFLFLVIHKQILCVSMEAYKVRYLLHSTCHKKISKISDTELTSVPFLRKLSGWTESNKYVLWILCFWTLVKATILRPGELINESSGIYWSQKKRGLTWQFIYKIYKNY